MLRTRGFGALGLSAAFILSLSGCASDEAPEPTGSAGGAPVAPAADAAELARRTTAGAPVLTLRQEGGKALPADGEQRRTAQVDVGASAGDEVKTQGLGSGATVGLKALGAAAVPGVLSDTGTVRYEDAFGTADLFRTVTTHGLIETVVVEDDDAPQALVWDARIDGERLEPVALSGDRLGLADALGLVRYQFEPVVISDAAGLEWKTVVRLDEADQIRVLIPHSRLTYPATVRLELSAITEGLGFGAHAGVNEIKGRVMVLLDTSGSMLFGFADGDGRRGDGPATSVFCDNDLEGNDVPGDFSCAANLACTLANDGKALFPVLDPDTDAVQDPVTDPSRMYAAKAALQNVIAAHGNTLDFGITRYREGSCTYTDWCCTPPANSTSRGRCKDTWDGNEYDYPDIAGDGVNQNLTYAGGCGTQAGGGRVLVEPLTGSSAELFEWVDWVEDFCSSTGSAGGRPRNPEIRANGSTPLARSIRTVRSDWFEDVVAVSDEDDPAYDPGDALYDDKRDCRPYVVVVMTDGADTCDSNNRDQAPVDTVTELRAVTGVNPVDVYVMGMGDPDAPNGADFDEDVLDAMAVAGGTGPQAYYAANQADIEAAFAEIVASTVLYEQCNAQDDTCNDLVDEGLGVYQECTLPANCGSGTCNLGRCTCANDGDCAAGFGCDAGFCRPACTQAFAQCSVDGVRKCSGGGSACCAKDGSGTCTAITQPNDTEVCNLLDDDCDGQVDEGLDCNCGLPEICNGEDDDCDGLVDNADPDLVGVGADCGFPDLGACVPGVTVCQPNGTVGCDLSGAQGPTGEDCNGVDDDCDGVIDGLTRSCFTGDAGFPDAQAGVGQCVAGLQVCAQKGSPTTDSWAGKACQFETGPSAELCDGVDNDCDGETDEGVVQGGKVTGESCCEFQSSGADLCGVGLCTTGTYQCQGTQVECAGGQGPTDEICDGEDNDCNGEDDDLPGKGDTCALANECAGELACDLETGSLVCSPTSGGAPEVCNGLDDDCDGQIDEEPDVSDNDSAIGVECSAPEAPNDNPPCRAGATACQGGEIVCSGAVAPKPETCDGVDNDCDGEADTPDPCPGDSVCDAGECRVPCRGGEFPCPGGQVCEAGYCVDVDAGTGGASGTGGDEPGGSDPGEGGAGTGAAETGGTGTGGSGTGGRGLDTGGSGTGASTGTGASASDKDGEYNYGLATGGGGCSCRTTPQPTSSWAWLVGAAVFVAAARRRRAA